jgi:hypothetical protein
VIAEWSDAREARLGADQLKPDQLIAPAEN